MNIVICENCEEENEYGAYICKKCGHMLYYQEGIESDIEDNIENDIVDEEDGYYSYKPDSIIFVNLSVDQAASLIEESNFGELFIVREKIIRAFPENKKCIIIIAEKNCYMHRYFSDVSVTLIIDNAVGNTRVQICTYASTNRDEIIEKKIKELFKKHTIT